MSCPVEYWIWLQRTLGAGKDMGELLSYFGDPRKIYEAGRNNLLMSGIINRKIADSLAMYSPSESYTIMKQCEDNGWKIITYNDKYFPSQLKNLNDCPVVLYVQGDETVLKSQFCVGIVGTRKASEYGIKAAVNISYSLAKSGAVIVSGGALGIDTAAHEAAMEAGGKTIAFLGSGLGCNYLMENNPLRQRISKNGALVSEFLPFTEPTRYTFPIRNRLISGLSRGTVIVEAGEKSGSVITAQHAMKQGRDVFAVPGEIYNKNHAGTNYLINNGAVPVFNVSDITDYYSDLIMSINGGVIPDVDYDFSSYNGNNPKQSVQVTWQTVETEVTGKQKSKKKTEVKTNFVTDKVIKSQLPSYATENAVKLYGIITDEPKTTDEYVIESGMTVQDVLSAITELELYGFVTMFSGKRYGLKIN